MENLASSNHFNGVILVAQKNQILLQEAYGTSSFQYDIPMKTNTRFRIGSLTKAFTAMAILLLHKEGNLDIHQTIDGFLPDFKHAHRITIHHLLTNTSGLYNFTESPDYWETTMRKQTGLSDILMSVRDAPLNFEPGEKMAYSNTGYLVLTAIIEKITELSYADFLQKRIFDPLGLLDTGVDDGRTVVKGLATGYTVWGDIKNAEYVDMSFPLGAYGLYSNAADLFKWARALRNFQLIDEELQRQMFSDFDQGYGYGWFIDSQKQTAGHFGDINGYVSRLALHLEEQLTVIVLSNINLTPVTKIAGDLQAIVLNRYESEELVSTKEEPLALESIFGKYSNGVETIEIGYDKYIYAVVPKMYGVRYKLKLMPAGGARFVSDFIREIYTFNEHSLEYVDCLGKASVYTRLQEKSILR